MKILHVIASVDPAGGGPLEGILRQDAACRAAGDTGTREIVSLDPPNAPFLAGCSMTVHAVGREPSGSRLLWRRALDYWRFSPDLVPWLRANIHRYDAVVVNGIWDYAPFAASRVLPGGGIPYFVFTHGMLDPWFQQTYPLKHLAKQAFWLVAQGRLLSGARSVFFTCEEERRKARGQFWWLSGYRETVVPYGASAPPPRTSTLEVAFRTAVPGLGDRPYLLFLSRIHRKKGCDILLEAFGRVASKHPTVDLVMAGPDQTGWRPELEQLAERLGVASRVHWTGPLYGDAKWGALYGADAFVLPSHQENFGIAVAEALGCGTPVLISDKVDIWREIQEARAGLVVSDTIAATELQLEEWLSQDHQTKKTVGEAAIKLFVDKFDVAMAGPEIFKTINRLI